MNAMRSSVPSVASEVRQSLSAHAHKPNSRHQPETDAPSSPFAEMLDSAAPPAEAPVAKRSERPDPSDRTGAGRPADKASKTTDKTSKADADPSQQGGTAAKATDDTASSDDEAHGDVKRPPPKTAKTPKRPRPALHPRPMPTRPPGSTPRSSMLALRPPTRRERRRWTSR
jgi:hypothetical protein